MSYDEQSAPTMVYASLREAQKQGGGSLRPIPSYALYKVAREEELCVYRGACRVFLMHYGTATSLSKSAKRTLEDLRDELAIPAERADLELQAAAQDAVVQGVHRSGVLARRACFYDGVEDVPLEHAVQHAEDDDCVLLAPSKAMRVEGASSEGGARTGGAPTAGRTGAPRRKTPQAALLASINKIGREVAEAAKELVYTNDPKIRKEKTDVLLAKKEALLQLKKEISTYE
ncbi:hypothetical protein STCU_07540 [Strigomonas culicis]|uniref:Uncharacterized protein n=1 Tax=Strigomonas culicis TaxID=28005 RepID=S9VKH1_9TRYP|nr:hypothetical protein STCU_07540 [Strigomonas culicis]|eukprot:EPY23700.1 hypothetical protein STCU_07540 [Strigomonas culicis]